MINKTLNSIVLLLALITYGCTHDHHDHDHNETGAHEHTSNSVTQFNSNTEIFMEYPQLAVGLEAEFLIHLNDLKVFKPVTEGKLSIEFVNASGNKVTSDLDKPARAGIFIPTITFDKPGTYTMRISLNSPQVSDKFSINNIIVYESENDIPHAEEVKPNLISFLKEQQWKIDFATEAVSKRALQHSVAVTGEIISKPELFSKLVSPVAGLLLPKNNSNFPKLGAYVTKGTPLLSISPSADASTSIQKIKADYLLAKSEFERVKNLFDKKAAAQKRLDESRYDFESKQAVYNSLIDQIVFTESGCSLVAPIDGYIENISINLGSQIASGQELITIVNPSRLILKANVPASKFEDANNSRDASFRIEGHKNEFRISKLNGRKISTASSLNTESRTVPVYFEFSNPQNQIKVGMYAEVFIKNGYQSEALSIPESAIVAEDGMHTVYVEIEGEGFEKRIIKTGITDAGYVQVVEGLNEGERVVTKGAYQVRLAALSPESAIGHGHVH
ncbi:MAG: efflux RND transporter periplasmic adaptor subunit [Bacteroidota bacterium]